MLEFFISVGNIGGQLLILVSDSIESYVRISWMMCEAGLPPLHIPQFFILSHFFLK